MPEHKPVKAYAAIRQYARDDGSTFEAIDATSIRYNKLLTELDMKGSPVFNIECPVIAIEEITLIRKGSAE